MEASAAGDGKLGVMLRVPYGVVGAISPFNFPLNLVAHKLGPAIAAGNAVVLKPAGQTPISAMKLAEILVEAGAARGLAERRPRPGLRGRATRSSSTSCTRAISFTGSAEVGWGIQSDAPHKKVNLELGSNAPLIVHSDGDWETAADKAKLHAYSHAGQSCISIQRILAPRGDRRRLHRAPRRQRRVAAGRRPARPRDRRRPADLGRGPRPRQGVDRRGRRRRRRAARPAASWSTRAAASRRPSSATPPRDAKVWCEEIFGPVATIDALLELRRGARAGQRLEVRPPGRRLHPRRRPRPRGRQAPGVRRRPDQRGARPSAPTRCPTAASRTPATPARGPPTRCAS